MEETSSEWSSKPPISIYKYETQNFTTYILIVFLSMINPLKTSRVSNSAKIGYKSTLQFFSASNIGVFVVNHDADDGLRRQ